MCYYIRRELRELSDKMRSDFLDAFMVLAEVPTNEGVTKYGKYYRSLEDFEIVHLRAAGARNLDHMHDGMGISTQHTAMTSEFEQALQAVNPMVSVPSATRCAASADQLRAASPCFHWSKNRSPWRKAPAGAPSFWLCCSISAWRAPSRQNFMCRCQVFGAGPHRS